MKKVILVILLTAAALALGLGLPEVATALQAKNAEQTEDAEIREVDLHIGSNLTHTEKLAVLSAEDCTVLNVGVAQHQTPASLSQHSWTLLEIIMSGYGAPLLNAASTQQVEQFALMASSGEQAFLFWEVLFSDGAGNTLCLHLDDESGLPLAMSYYCADSAAPIEKWCVLSLYAMGDLCDLSLADASGESSEDPSYSIDIPSGAYDHILVTDRSTTATVKVQAGSGWFTIGDQIG